MHSSLGCERSLPYDIRVAEAAEGNYCSMQIRDEHMQMWDVDEATLYREFMKNMDGADDVLFEDLVNILTRLLRTNAELKCEEIEMGELPERYIPGSRSKVNGAVQMCNPKALQEVAEYVKDDFRILPCSIHEVLVSQAGPDPLPMYHFFSKLLWVKDRMTTQTGKQHSSKTSCKSVWGFIFPT